MNRNDPLSAPLRRRAFVVGVAGAGALGFARKTEGIDAAAAQDPAPEVKPDALDAEIDARLALVVARYGGALDEDARKAIRSEIHQHVRRGQRLRAFALDNGDGPYPVLVPYRDTP